MDEQQAFVDSYTVDGDILVINLHGKFDNKTAPQFDAAVEKLFEEGAKKIIIDCAHLSYINSAGLTKLIGLQVKLRRRGGIAKLAAVYSMVADLLKITNLDRLFEIYGDTEFARESFYE